MANGGVRWAVAAAVAGSLALHSSADAALSARITRVVRQVVVRPSGPTSAPTADNVIASGAVVRTAADARVELTFADRTVTRVGAKTNLSIGAASLVLHDGALLIDAPRGASAATVQSGTIMIEAGGTTCVVERLGAAYVKILALQGTARIFLPAIVGESILLKPGAMLILKPDAKSLPEPVDFDLSQLARTSVFLGREFGPLPSRAELAAEIAMQRANPNLLPTNLVIYGRGTAVTLTEPTAAKGKARSSASPAPRPSPKR